MQKLKKYRWWIAIVFFLGIAFFLSSQNGTDTAETSMFITNVIVNFLGLIGITADPAYLHLKVRLCAHFIVYIAVGFLLCKAMMSTRWRRPVFKAWIFGCAIGILDEAHKGLIPGRCCDVREIFINCLCVTVICAVLHLKCKADAEQKNG